MKKSDRFMGLSFGQVGLMVFVVFFVLFFAIYVPYMTYINSEGYKSEPKPEPVISISLIYNNQVTVIDSIKINQLSYNGSEIIKFSASGGRKFVWSGDYLIKYVK